MVGVVDNVCQVCGNHGTRGRFHTVAVVGVRRIVNGVVGRWNVQAVVCNRDNRRGIGVVTFINGGRFKPEHGRNNGGVSCAGHRHPQHVHVNVV